MNVTQAVGGFIAVTALGLVGAFCYGFDAGKRELSIDLRIASYDLRLAEQELRRAERALRKIADEARTFEYCASYAGSAVADRVEGDDQEVAK
ncbi:hypothetical protein [Lysobacter antibioticus]|uniref:hypothetical protein n=1 Tax=Lysobacter antibioticus TaxID=84531 RepID=UPI0007E8E040|nr:hypothetical protein [Lysobacter antibioticus]